MLNSIDPTSTEVSLVVIDVVVTVDVIVVDEEGELVGEVEITVQMAIDV